MLTPRISAKHYQRLQAPISLRDTVRAEHAVQLVGEVGEHGADVLHHVASRPVPGPARSGQQAASFFFGFLLGCKSGVRLSRTSFQLDGAGALVGEGHVHIVGAEVVLHRRWQRVHRGGRPRQSPVTTCFVCTENTVIALGPRMHLHRGLHHRGGGGCGGGHPPHWVLELVELLVEGFRVGEWGDWWREVVVDAWDAVVEGSHRGRHLRGRW